MMLRDDKNIHLEELMHNVHSDYIKTVLKLPFDYSLNKNKNSALRAKVKIKSDLYVWGQPHLQSYKQFQDSQCYYT